ncbi:MAG: hypothetical protein GOMPHAMPRED_004105 [Gomphillus americanus]|uniref:Conserved oligomeric Golgi complex subunit 8 n=1 Tax=Gomphillus americanus TaxID=1940652 RepID=A0A8H3FNV1_9LECA|nr:MAG: hypothetical protein GOMPHAMPRED_004105 [Gomphillus americanus]
MAAEPLFDLLRPYLRTNDNGSESHLYDEATREYLDRLLSLQLGAINNSEAQSLAQSAHTNIRALQALSTKSSRTLVNSADELRTLGTAIPQLTSDIRNLRAGIDTLDNGAIKFAEKYSRSVDNEILERRKRALLTLRNVDRVSEVLDLPTLLSSAIHVSTTQATAAGSNYTSALDLYSHIKRLRQTYPESQLIESVSRQAEDSMQEMKMNLIRSLKGHNIKLAAGLRTIGWLRRIAPELSDSRGTGIDAKEGSYGALFLVCRLANLLGLLDALEALRILADGETAKRLASQNMNNSVSAWSGGQQTERYLKRYIEIFREQSFAIVSMFRSIFPSTEPGSAEELGIQLRSLGLKSPMPTQSVVDKDDPLYPLPSALTTFPLHLVDLLSDTLWRYLPNVQDKSSRESLLTQVLYCAGSLARLGGDFSMILANLDEDGSDIMTDWVAVMKKHRVLAGRLQSMANNQGKEGIKVGGINGMVHKIPESLSRA